LRRNEETALPIGAAARSLEVLLLLLVLLCSCLLY
jgi:hypothetical protein